MDLSFPFTRVANNRRSSVSDLFSLIGYTILGALSGLKSGYRALQLLEVETQCQCRLCLHWYQCYMYLDISTISTKDSKAMSWTHPPYDFSTWWPVLLTHRLNQAFYLRAGRESSSSVNSITITWHRQPKKHRPDLAALSHSRCRIHINNNRPYLFVCCHLAW